MKKLSKDLQNYATKIISCKKKMISLTNEEN